MDILSKLSSSLGERSDDANIALAKDIAAANDKDAVQQLVTNLTNKDKKIQSNCVKTLYEIAEINPALLAGHAQLFIDLLGNKNNRLQWGAMTAIDCITPEAPSLIYKALPKIMAVAAQGSVITKDHCMGILTKLYSIDKYSEDAFALFTEQIKTAATNQLPKYAEDILPFVKPEHKASLITILTNRLDDIEKDTKRTRVEKVIKKLGK